MLSLRKALSAGLRHSQQTCFGNMKCILHAPFLDIGTLPVRSAKFACASVFSGPQSTAASSAGAFAREQASYVQGACTQPLLGETIACNLAKTVQQYPNKLAVSSFHQKKCLSYSEFHQAVEQVARGLLGIGIRPGDRVAILSPNNLEWLIIMYATAKMGAVLVPLNPNYKERELTYLLQHSRARMLVAAASCKGIDMVQMVHAATCHMLVFDSHLEDCTLEHLLVLNSPASGNLSWEDLHAAAAKVSASLLAQTEARLQFDEPAQIQYTSGTTGKPKGVTLSHHSVLNNGFFIGEGNQYTESDKVCLPVPLFHCFGCVLGALAITSHGACIVLPGEGFDPQQTLEAVQQEHCTALYGVPTMFIAELALPEFDQYDLSSLRKGIMAGSPCPQEIMEKVVGKMHMKEVTICYGMTETSPVSFQSSPDNSLQERVTTVGRVHPHIEAKIVDPQTGCVLPRGIPGELCIRGYSVMLGYWDDEPATQQVIDKARWMHTGDIAVLDEKGFCKIVGRLKDMIIRGGENVSPREVEEVLYQHPSVLDVQVIGVPDDKYGEAVCAWVRKHPSSSATSDKLEKWCEGRLAAFKVPRQWKYVDSYPMTASGKVQKYLMRQQHIAECGVS